MARELELSFDINTINHLGVKLYSTIPPMLAELVSNAWDADAHNVWIRVSNEDKKIEVTDDGVGMSFDELNDKFLKVGRNRRIELNEDTTADGRKVLGKKGLGKLSMFGIGPSITVSSVKDNMITSFKMDYDLISTEPNYKPEMIRTEEPIEKHSGTTILIESIRRKANFDLASIENGLRTRFHIFSSDFAVHINDEITIDTPEAEDESYQFTWIFPDDFEEELKTKSNELMEFASSNRISGHICTAETPLRKELQGIVLFSRGKLVQENKTFDKRGNDNFFSYMTGSFDVDFIDEDLEIDNCSTDRKSLAWDNSDNDALIQLTESIVAIAQKKWRMQRKEAKKKKISDRGHDIDKWVKSLNKAEQPLARKLTTAIIENDSISEEQAYEYVGYIKDMYGFQSFRDFTAQLDEMESLGNNDAIKLLTDWNIIEAKEYAKIATGRMATIEQFDKYIQNNASENKVIQKFLEEFPWLLDPKMEKFEREVTYTNLLKRTFDDSDKPESDRRLDFLCTNDSGEVHIIELKRPKIKITAKELQQISEYVEFIQNKFPQTINHISGYLISDNMTFGPGAETMMQALESKSIYVKTYSELLGEARRYNKDLYDAYQEITDAKNN